MSQVVKVELKDETYSNLANLAARMGQTTETIVRDWIERETEARRTRAEPGSIETDPRVLLKLSLAERRRILAAQAEMMVEHYSTDHEWREWDAADLDTARDHDDEPV